MSRFDELPVEIQEKMLEYQVRQGNPRNPDIFRKKISTNKFGKGFHWWNTSEGKTFWNLVINDKRFDLFYTIYPKQLNIWF